MRLVCRTAFLLLYLEIQVFLNISEVAAQQTEQWPVCPAAAPPDTLEANSAQLGRVEVTATAQGCRILLQDLNRTAIARVHRLASNVVIAGVYDGSFGRPPAVVFQREATAAAAAATAAVNATTNDSVLLVPEGGPLQLQGLLLVNVTLADPTEDPSLALLPSGLSGLGLTAPGSLKLWDVQMKVSQQQLQQYVAFFLGMPAVIIHTNGENYLYIHHFGGPAANDTTVAAVVEAHSVTLIAPEAASLLGTPLRLLQSLASRSSSRSSGATGVSPAALAAAQGDTAGIVNATDSYILAATNTTLLPLLRWLVTPQESFQPLVVHLASNVTLSPRVWGAAWPATALNITRQVLFVGSSIRATSIDLGMDVGQLLLTGRYANVTLFNIALENLAYGDEHSGQDAEGTSILMPSQLWAFQYRRLQARVVLRNCTLVLPGQRFIDRLIYWANAFNSELDFWRQQTQYMRNKLMYTAMDYVPGHMPGEYVLTAMRKADLMMFNTTLTTQPVAAPLLQLPFNSSIHQELAPGTEDIAIGPIVTIEDLAVTLHNINKQQYDCYRRYVLLPTSPDGSIPYWGPADLEYSRVTGGIPSPSPQQQQQQQAAADPSSTDPAVPASLQAARAAWGASLSPVWPPKGGQHMLRCSVQFQGAQMVDVGFVRGMLVAQGQGSGSGQPGSGPDNSLAAAAAADNARATPLLLFVQMGLQGLPQGEAAGAPPALRSSSSSSGGGGGGVVRKHTWDASGAATPTGGGLPAAASTAGGSSWVSQLPAEAYTHLLWFVARNVAGNDLVVLSNVTLIIPAPEAAQMAAAATAALQASGGRADQAVLSMVYPTAASGPLPVVYRSLVVTNNTLVVGKRVAESASAAAAGQVSSNTPLTLHRHLLQQQGSDVPQQQQQQQQQLTICAGSVRGLGISGTNVCMVAAEADAPLPPDYYWLDAASSSSSSSGGSFPAWGIAVIVISTTLISSIVAAAVFRHDRHHKRSAAAAGSMKQLLGPAAGGAAHGLALNSATSTPGSRSTDSMHINKDSAVLAQAFSMQGCAAELQSVHSSSPRTAQAATAAAGSRLDLVAPSSMRNAAIAAAGIQLQPMLGDAGGAGCPGPARTFGTRSTRSSSRSTPSLDPSGPMFDPGEGDQELQLQPGGRFYGGSGTPYFSQDKQQQQHALQAQPASTFERVAGAISTISADMHAKRCWGGTSLPVHCSKAVASSSSTPRFDNKGRSDAVPYLLSGSPRLACKVSPASGGGGAAAGLQAGSSSPHRVNSLIHVGDVGFGEQAAAWQQQQQQHDNKLAAATPVAAAVDAGNPTAAKLPQQQLSRRASLSTTVAHTFSLRRQGITQQQQQLQLHEVIGSGTFGIVYRATWRGIPAAVKVLQLPYTVGGSRGLQGAGGVGGAGSGSKREHMLVMETALGASISHPNIVQVYTYALRPLGPLLASVAEAAAAPSAPSAAESCCNDSSSSSSLRAGPQVAGSPRKGSGSSSGQHMAGYELQLVMEYCPVGSLRAAIDAYMLDDPCTGRPHYGTILSLALGVARAMQHLHAEGVLHGDLKAGNVLLKHELSPSQAFFESPCGAAAAAAGAAGGPLSGDLVAKVADLGLACLLDEQDTHISGVHRGTLSHMSPELLLHGHASRASDVYAMGILLWEMATGLRAFAGCPKALLGAAVVRDRARPAWPDDGAPADDIIACAAIAGAAAAACHDQSATPPASCSRAARGSRAAELQPPEEYRQLTEACWAHELHDRPTFEQIAVTLQQLIAQEEQRHAALAACAQQQPPELQHPQDAPQRSASDQAVRSSNVLQSVGEVVGDGQPPPTRVYHPQAPFTRQVRFQPGAASAPAVPAAAAAAAVQRGACGRGQIRNRLDEATVQRRAEAAAAVAALLGVPRCGTAAAAATASADTTAAAAAAAPARPAAGSSPFAMLKDIAWEPIPE